MKWPFENWLKIAVTQLGLSPSEFWQLSLHDWRGLTASNAVEPLPRKVFESLREIYPDGGLNET